MLSPMQDGERAGSRVTLEATECMLERERNMYEGGFAIEFYGQERS